MGSKHDYNFCPSCGHKLEGDETTCPFCGYRLLEQENKADEVLQKPIESNIGTNSKDDKPAGLFDNENICPTCKTTLREDEVVCPFCGMKISKVSDNKSEKELGEVTPVAELPKDENHLISKFPTNNETIIPPIIENENIQENQSIVPNEPGAGGKKKTGLIIILAAAFVVIILLGTFLLQYSGVINIPALNGLIPGKDITVVKTVTAKNYYFCYASALISGKTQVILSNVFLQEQDNNSEVTATKSFSKFISLRYPKDYKLFAPILCKKYATFELASKEREKVQSAYQKKKYTFRFVDLK
jgi:RNA polymerase subunit RPABC4/transcription elongation factor Spt4